MVFGDDTLEFHSYKGAPLGYNYLTFGSILHWIDPGAVTIYLVDNHMVVVPFAVGVWEFSRLVVEYFLSWIVGCNINIFSIGVSSIISALLISVVELVFLVDRTPSRWLCICPFWVSSDLGKSVEILDVDKGLCEVVALSDAFEPGCFCGETGGAVEISNFWFDDGELVDIVD